MSYYTWIEMRQINPARSFYVLLALLAMLAGVILLVSIVLNSAGWLGRMRLSLPVGIHSPLSADYSADLRGVFVAPAEMRLLEEALRDQHATDPAGVIADLLTPVPTVTPRLEDLLPLTGTPAGPTATLLPGVTPTLTWTPTLTLTFEWTPTATDWRTRTPGPTPTRTPTERTSPTKTAQFTPTHQPTYTHTVQPSATHTPYPTPTRTPQPTPTSGSYPPPVTAVPTTPAYP